jgi:hypothetical protein
MGLKSASQGARSIPLSYGHWLPRAPCNLPVIAFDSTAINPSWLGEEPQRVKQLMPTS